jgi:protein-disulfide isomerase
MRRLYICILAVAGLGLWFALHAASGKKSAFDKPAFEAYIRQVELLPDGLTVSVGDPKPSPFPGWKEVPVELTAPNGLVPLRYFVSNDGQLIVKGAIFDVNKRPFQPELDKLTTDRQPSFGAAGAPVTIVVFSDFECPNCREEAKVLRDNVQKTFPKEVRVYFKDFPLEKMHPWAKPAAMAGRCVFREDPAAFWDYFDWIYEHQAEILADNLKTKVLGWAQTKNLDALKLTQCIDSKATEQEVDREVAEGRSLQVSGTPTIFINGRPITGAVPWNAMEQIIRREIGYQQAAAKSEEKCCEVTIPSLAPKQQ